MEYADWRDIDMHHEEKDAVEEALIERIHRLERKAKEWMEKAQMVKGKGKGSLVRTYVDFAKMEREEANMAIRALVKLRGGLTLRVIDCTVEVEKDAPDSEPGVDPDPKIAA